MKNSKPLPPKGGPPGTIYFGGAIRWFSLAIEISADDLVPEEITALLAVLPTQQQEKGKVHFLPDGKTQRIGKFGRWSLELSPKDTDEWDACEAIKLLLAKVPDDPSIWQTIAARAKVRISLALELENFTQGLEIDLPLIRRLADYQMQLNVSVYCGHRNADAEPDNEEAADEFKLNS